MPVVESAKLESSGGGGKGFLDKYPWYHWELASKQPLAEVVAFYDARLPAAKRTVEQLPDEAAPHLVLWTYAPDGAPEGELIAVTAQGDASKTDVTIAWSAPEERFPKKK